MARVPASKRTSPETACVSARLSPDTSMSPGPVVTRRGSSWDAAVAIAFLSRGGAGRYRTSAGQPQVALGVDLLGRDQGGAERGDEQVGKLLTRQIAGLGPVEDRRVHIAEPAPDRGS